MAEVRDVEGTTTITVEGITMVGATTEVDMGMGTEEDTSPEEATEVIPVTTIDTMEGAEDEVVAVVKAHFRPKKRNYVTD